MLTNVVAVGLTTQGQDGRPDSLLQKLQAIRAAGADAAEIALYDLDVVAGGRPLERQFARVLEIASGFALRYSVHGPIASNPWALRAISERLLEAAERGLWSEPPPEDLDTLKAAYLENEGLLEEGSA